MPTRPLITSYRDAMRLFPDMWHKVGLAGLVPLVLLYPFVADAHWLTVGNNALVSIVGAVALMVLTGFCGQISLGHAAFLALGAYTTAVLGNRLHLPFYVLLPLGGALAAAVGVGIGFFALRLKGLYLAIVTIGLGFLVNHTLLSFPEYTKGLTGLSVPVYTLFGSTPEHAGDIHQAWSIGPFELTFERKLFFIFLVLAIGAAWLATNLQRTRTGRAMMAVRDHDMAAAALGVEPARTKVVAFAVSSFLAGIAGGMFAMQQQYITVDPPFNLYMSVQFIAMIVFGGIGTVFGAVVGAVAYVVLVPIAETVGPAIPLLSGLSSAQQSTVIFSVLVLVFLVFEPLGLYGIWMRVKRYFMAWPFRY